MLISAYDRIASYNNENSRENNDDRKVVLPNINLKFLKCMVISSVFSRSLEPKRIKFILELLLVNQLLPISYELHKCDNSSNHKYRVKWDSIVRGWPLGPG